MGSWLGLSESPQAVLIAAVPIARCDWVDRERGGEMTGLRGRGDGGLTGGSMSAIVPI